MNRRLDVVGRTAGEPDGLRRRFHDSQAYRIGKGVRLEQPHELRDRVSGETRTITVGASLATDIMAAVAG